MRFGSVLLGAGVMLSAAVAMGQSKWAAPDDEAPPLQRADRLDVYYLAFEFERPRWIEVDVSVRSDAANPRSAMVTKKQRFFYMPYKVTNFTDKNIDYRPEFTLVTSTGREYQSESNQPVLDAIKKEIRRDYLVSQSEIKSTGVAAGETNAKHSAAIWKAFDGTADEFDVFVGALTNYPPRQIKNPLFKPVQPGGAPGKTEEEYISVSRVLRAHYLFPGNQTGREKSWASLERVQWTWR